MPSDRLTPAQLRDLADVMVRCPTSKPYEEYFREEAARREAEAKPQNGRGHIPLITCPGSTKSCMGYDCLDKGCLDGEPMASGGVSVPELRNSNISLGGCEVCTTPTACKQEKHCDHFDCEWTRAVPDDELGRASRETGPSPSPVTTGLPPQGEREGPGSAAAPTEPVVCTVCLMPAKWGDECRSFPCPYPKRPVEDKPAPTDDDLVARINAACVGWPTANIPWPHRILHECRDRIEAQAREIAELRVDRDRWLAEWQRSDGTIKRLAAAAEDRNEVDSHRMKLVIEAEARVRQLERECGQWQEASGQANVRAEQLEDKWEAEKARADGLAANNATLIEALKLCRELVDHIAKAPLPLFRAQATKVRECIDAALTEGGA